MDQDNDIIEIDLLEILGILLSRIWLILGAGLFCAVCAFLISEFVVHPVYESSTKVYILNKQDSNGVTYSDVQMGSQLTKDYAQLITSRYVLEDVVQRLGLNLSYSGIMGKVTVSTPTDTRIVAITVKDEDPVLAMNIANAVREAASEHIQNVMDIEAVNIVETANMPTSKAGPAVFKWTLAGAAIGLLIACGLSLVFYIADDTIKSSDDVQKYLNLSTLALIPLSEEELKNNSHNKKRKR